ERQRLDGPARQHQHGTEDRLVLDAGFLVLANWLGCAHPRSFGSLCTICFSNVTECVRGARPLVGSSPWRRRQGCRCARRSQRSAASPRLRPRGFSRLGRPWRGVETSRMQLRLERVSKHWGTAKAVDDASFATDSGKLVVLLGPSGCGKSTTLRMIAGLDTPSEGRIFIDGRDVTGAAPAERRI